VIYVAFLTLIGIFVSVAVAKIIISIIINMIPNKNQ